jgi:hypothetical protein
VVPTHAFMSAYIKMRLTNEMAAQHGVGHDAMANFRIINTDVGPLEIVIVQEEKKEFLLIGTENDYLDYVMERTIL